MPLHFREGQAVEKLVPASTKTVKVMGPQAVPEAILHELLVHLAALGVFERFPPPASAMSGEVWQALGHLGDGAWLAGLEGFDKDVPANARRWVERYGRGLAVPSRDDTQP